MIEIKKKLKRAVIKEEYVKLTGSTEEAIILNQFIYWSERTKDVSKYLLEEKTRLENGSKEGDVSLKYGWIYKKAEELKEEVMLSVSVNTVRKHINQLVKKGYLNKRSNPIYRWDKTFQYRVNLVKVTSDLKKIGYRFEDENLLTGSADFDARETNTEQLNNYNEFSKRTGITAIPEITTDTNTNNLSEISSSLSIDDDMKSNDSKQFNKICELYLKLSGKSKISSNDYKAILEVVKEQWNTNLVLKWIEDCFRQFKPQHKNDQIRSFRYVTNYIFDQAHKNYFFQEVVNNKQNTGDYVEDEYFERYG